MAGAVRGSDVPHVMYSFCRVSDGRVVPYVYLREKSRGRGKKDVVLSDLIMKTRHFHLPYSIQKYTLKDFISLGEEFLLRVLL